MYGQNVPAGPRPRGRRTHGAGCVQSRVLRENGLLERAQLRTGIGAELVREDPPGALQRGQRIALPAGAVEREHQEAPPVFAQRIFGDEALQVADDLGVPPQRQPRLDQAGEGAGPQFGQPPPLVLGERRVRPVLVRVSAPQAQSGGQGMLGPRRVATGQQRTTAGHQLADAQGVELVGRRRQRVAGAPTDDETAWRALRPLRLQRLAQAGEVDLQRLARARWAIPVPDRIDEPVDADGARCPRGEQRQDQPLPGARNRHRVTGVAPYLQRSEDRDTHSAKLPSISPGQGPSGPGPIRSPCRPENRAGAPGGVLRRNRLDLLPPGWMGA